MFFCRDDLYRVELDNMAGEEMFYSKVRMDTKERRTRNNPTLNSALPYRNGPGSPTRTTFECVGWRANTRYVDTIFIIALIKPGAMKHMYFLLYLTQISTQHYQHITEGRRSAWGPKATFFPTCSMSFVFRHGLYSEESQRNETILKW